MNKKKHSHESAHYEREDTPAPDGTRRNFIRAPLALGAGSIVAPSLFGGLAAQAKADGKRNDLRFVPRLYPLARFEPQIDLRGKLAVITGASRGNGRAVGEALTALGVDVIGTSRNPTGVPNPPSFPLLTLDIVDPGSVLTFAGALQAHPLFRQHGQIDILANNAGRFVLGEIVPLPPTNFSFYLAQRDLGMRTVYFGHVMVTNAILPLMPQKGYSRILFTASIASYVTGGTLPAESFVDTYNSGKFALRLYASNLDSALRAAGSSIRVSTVNPYAMNTGLAQGGNALIEQQLFAENQISAVPFACGE